MGTPSDDYDLVLDSASATEAVLARDLLSGAGIPSLLHGPDFDVAELGAAAHAVARGQSVYVPKGQGERALEVLREAWGDVRPPRGGSTSA